MTDTAPPIDMTDSVDESAMDMAFRAFSNATGSSSERFEQGVRTYLDASKTNGVGCGMAIAGALLYDLDGDSPALREIMATAGLRSREACERIGVDPYDLGKLEPWFERRREDARDDAENDAAMAQEEA